MAELHLYDIIRRPVITEKSNFIEDMGKYVFEVHPDANKIQVREAVEIIAREKAVGIDTQAREAVARERLDAERAALVPREERGNAEKALVDRILELRGKLRGEIGRVEGTESKLEQAADAVAAQTQVQTAGGDSGDGQFSEEERADLLEQLKDQHR